MAGTNVFQSAQPLSSPQIEVASAAGFSQDTQPGMQLAPDWWNNVAPEATENPFAQALARSSGSLSSSDTTEVSQDTQPGMQQAPDWWNNVAPEDDQTKLEEATRQQELAKRAMELHARVNPPELTALFDGREEQEKNEISRLQAELLRMAVPIDDSEPEAVAPLRTQVVESGAYFQNFYHKLERWIRALVQNAQSSKAWAETSRVKNQSKTALGEGSQYDQTSAVLELQQNPERNTSGGA